MTSPLPVQPARGVFDLVGSKFRRPLVRQGTVHRSSLIERLAQGDGRPVVSVVAPPGYGKTTLLSQWAERNGQSFAWVSVDERDNDPKVLLTYVAEALNAVEPIDERVFDALASPGSSVPGSVVPRLGAAFSSMTSPVALILDDVHALRNRECQAALSVLADHVPGGSRLAMAGRAQPPLRSLGCGPREGFWRSAPAICRLTATRHRCCCAARTSWSARMTWRNFTGGPRDGRPVCTWRRCTCGRAARWRGAAASFGGDDRLVSEYVEAEFLARISHRSGCSLPRPPCWSGCAGRCARRCSRRLGPPRRWRAGAVELAARAAGPAGAVVPLPSPVPRHAPGGAATPRARPGPGPAPAGRAVVRAQRGTRRGTGVLDEGGRRRCGGRLVGALAFAAYQQGRVATAERWFGWLKDHGADRGAAGGRRLGRDDLRLDREAG